MRPLSPGNNSAASNTADASLPAKPAHSLTATESAVLNALPLACYVLDATGRITFCNPAARELLGRSPVLGEEFWSGSRQMFELDGTPLPLDRCPAAIALQERRSVRGIEAWIERPDGSRRRVAPHPDPIFDAAGNFLGVINVLVDVTEQHRANLDAYRLAAIVESSEDAVISKTLDGIITSWNGGAQRIFGYTPEEAIGRSITLLIPSDRQHEELTIIAQLTAGQRIEHFETIRQHKDGRRLFVSLTVSPIRDREGRIVGASKIARDVTIQKRQETELRQREQLYRAIGESIDYGVWVCDADGRNLYVSDSFLKLVGLTQEECSNVGWASVLHPDEVDATVAAWRECVRTGSFWEREHRFKGVDGEWHPVLARGCPVYDKGNIVRWVGINLDISAFKRTQAENVTLNTALQRELAEQRTTEARLRKRGQRMQLLSETLAELLAASDPDQILQRLFPKAAALVDADTYFNFMLDADGQTLRLHSCMGVSAETVAKMKTLPLGQAICGTVAQTMQPVIVNDLQASTWDKAQLARGLGLRTYACNPLVASGRALGTVSFASRTRDAFEEDELEFLHAVVQSTAVAIERRHHLDAVRRSEQQLRLVTDHAPIYLAHCDRNHRFKFVNRTYAQRYGRSPEDIVGRHVSEITGAEAYTTYQSYMTECLEGRRIEFELEIPYSTLGRRWVHVIYEPERQADGAIVGLVAVIVDITQRKHAEQELERARDEALAASRAKDSFLAALSHELRTPLNPVLLLASAAAVNPELSAEVRADFDTIRKHVDLEARLIEDLLDLTRISHGKLALQMATLEANDLLRDALATVRAEVHAKSLQLAASFASESAPVWGDSVRLQQVFWNIVNNAVKFTPAGGRIEVKSSVDPVAQRFQVSFTDTGIGMTAQEISQAFEAFAQGEHAMIHGRQRYGGLGLGLSISRMLVEAHGGTIRAVSAGRGQGTTLSIELPLQPVDAAKSGKLAKTTGSAAAELPAAPKSAPVPSRSPWRVLLIEDHAPTREALERLLTRRNCTLRSVGSAAEALACAGTATFDLVISDLGLPDGDGYQLMSKLQETRPGLPGIALSGYGMEEDLARAKAAGFAAHLVKPVKIEALERAMARVVAPAGETSRSPVAG